MTLPKSFGVKLAGSRWGAGLQAAVQARLRLRRCARRRCAAGRGQRARRAGARARDIRVRTRVTGARRDGGLWRATLQPPDGARTEVTARAIVNAGGPVGEAGARQRAAARADEGAGSPREGQPHRRAARASGGARLHPAERRQAHRVRHSVPGPLLADRHDRRSGRRVRAPGDFRRRDRLPAGARQCLSRDGRSPAPTSSGPTAACGRCTTTGPAIRRP